MSYHQPGPYGGQQPQQPGPYGQPPQAPQPGPYGQPPQAPYGQVPPQGPYGQAPYGQVPPPPPGRGTKKTGLIVAVALAVVAAGAVGGYFAFAGGDGKGGGGVKDDGPHKLTAPQTVLGEYEKDGDSADAPGGVDLDKAEAAGVKNPEDVQASYKSGSEDNPMSQKILSFGGVYGDVEDPEGVVDHMFTNARKKKESSASGGRKITLVGEPKRYEPAGLDGAVLKCQEMKMAMGSGAGSSGTSAGGSGPSEISAATCIWGDHSTIGYIVTTDVAGAVAGKSADLDEAATTTAKFRGEVRVKL